MSPQQTPAASSRRREGVLDHATIASMASRMRQVAGTSASSSQARRNSFSIKRISSLRWYSCVTRAQASDAGEWLDPGTAGAGVAEKRELPGLPGDDDGARRGVLD